MCGGIPPWVAVVSGGGGRRKLLGGGLKTRFPREITEIILDVIVSRQNVCPGTAVGMPRQTVQLFRTRYPLKDGR